jgi:hypothetical protein
MHSLAKPLCRAAADHSGIELKGMLQMAKTRSFSVALGLAAVLFSSNASAVYNANMDGVVVAVWTYTENDSIYFQLSNQPATHPSCESWAFVIPSIVPVDRRKALFARLMVAKLTGETINIGYDNMGDCADGRIRVHRVG